MALHFATHHRHRSVQNFFCSNEDDGCPWKHTLLLVAKGFTQSPLNAIALASSYNFFSCRKCYFDFTTVGHPNQIYQRATAKSSFFKNRSKFTATAENLGFG